MLRFLLAAALTMLLALPAMAATPVNVNKADATNIAKSLDGIGPSKARAIVAWREEHGPFKKLEDLTQIKGIGQSTLDRNREAIKFSGEAGAKADAKTTAKSATKKAKKAKARKVSVESD